MRVLVIGGTEFVSWHIVAALVQAGHAATAVTRGRTTKLPLPADVEHLLADRRDHDALDRVLAGRSFEAIVDVAYAPTTIEDVSILVDRFDGRIERFLFCSTTAVYSLTTSRPDVALHPITEDAETEPIPGQAYSANKWAVEQYLFARHARTGFPVVSIRPTYVYGPHNKNPNEAFVFDRLRLGRPIVLPGDGEYTLDFVHVEDCAQEFLLALTNPIAVGRAYNSTDGHAFTQRSYVEFLGQVAGLPVRFLSLPRDRFDSATGVHRPGHPRRGFFGGNLDYMQHICHSPARAVAELGWRFRSPEDGLRQTYDWYLGSDLARQTPDLSIDDRLLAAAGTLNAQRKTQA